MKLSVALNSRILLAPRTGIGTYVAELAQALQRESDVDMTYFYGWRWGKVLIDAAMPSYSGWATAAKRFIPGAYRVRRLLEQRVFTRGVCKKRPDVYHEPSLWPLDFNGPMVMTLHDLTHVHFPQTQPRDRLLEIERRLVSGVARASRILVDSAFIGREVIQYFGVAEEKVVMAPLACSAIFQPRDEQQLTPCLRRLGLRWRRFILSVGTLEPRKNLLLTLRAHQCLPAEMRRRFPLLVVGMPGWRAEQLTLALANAMRRGDVYLAGYLEQAELACVMAAAKMLVFPSLYEGFGLPILEAMASGTPVIVSHNASLPEIAGEAGLYVDTEDVLALTQQMRRLIEDDACWLACQHAGLTQSAKFSWVQCAHITAEVYRQAANS